jgi:hypothetical protein
MSFQTWDRPWRGVLSPAHAAMFALRYRFQIEGRIVPSLRVGTCELVSCVMHKPE